MSSSSSTGADFVAAGLAAGFFGRSPSLGFLSRAGVERYMIAVLPGSLERMKEKHPPVRSWHGPFDTSAAAIAFYRARRDEVLTATDNVARS